ncbi:MAG TPA: DUF2071 domain-containing protein [Bacillales bacterium]
MDSSHRPWPVPDSPWIMTQNWRHVLFAHWPVDPDLIRPYIPDTLELDLYDGQAWIGYIFLKINGVRLRYTPVVPFLSSYPELNVRTYVNYGDKSGVYFFSLDADHLPVVMGARSLFYLPYTLSKIAVKKDRKGIACNCRRVGSSKTFEARYWPASETFCAEKGSLDYWLSERYCLYTEHDGGLYRCDILHEPWPLQQAEAEISKNTMMVDFEGISLSRDPLLHYADRQKVLMWGLQLV